jgi:hypothetical protein
VQIIMISTCERKIDEGRAPSIEDFKFSRQRFPFSAMLADRSPLSSHAIRKLAPD